MAFRSSSSVVWLTSAVQIYNHGGKVRRPRSARTPIAPVETGTVGCNSVTCYLTSRNVKNSVNTLVSHALPKRRYRQAAAFDSKLGYRAGTNDGTGS
jgi:hypothetical protein